MKMILLQDRHLNTATSGCILMKFFKDVYDDKSHCLMLKTSDCAGDFDVHTLITDKLKFTLTSNLKIYLSTLWSVEDLQCKMILLLYTCKIGIS